MASSGTILLVVVLSTFVAYSYQLKCYNCADGNVSKFKKISAFASGDAGSCGNFSDSLLVDCPTSTQVCTKVDGEMEGASISTHACGTTKADCDTLDGTEALGVSVSCYSCDTDKCNSASGIVATTSLLALSLIAAAFY